MATTPDTIEELVGREYRHGFVTEIESDSAPRGLNEDTIRLISAKKNDPSGCWSGGSSPTGTGRAWSSSTRSRSGPTSTTARSTTRTSFTTLRRSRRTRRTVRLRSIRSCSPRSRSWASRSGNGIAVDAVFDSVSVATTFKEKRFYNSILDGRSRGVFHGRIVVHKDAQKTDAKQTNRNLLLSEEAQIDTKPQLEIHADDVKCTHGATIGQVDEDAIFYLRFRGIPEASARDLLLEAFAGEILERMKEEPIRRHLEGLVSQWLRRARVLEGAR